MSVGLLARPLAHAVIEVLPVAYRGPIALALGILALAYLLATNSKQFRLRVPGFDLYYAHPLNPQVRRDSSLQGNARFELTPVDALAPWTNSGRNIVVLCLSGGAYRSAFWSSIVIDHLASKNPNFRNSVHLITGASGGMVAGAYLAAMQAEGSDEPVTDRIEADTRESLKLEGRAFPIARDSLSAVAQWLVKWDLRDLFLFGTSRIDRGMVLERSWRTIDKVTFAELGLGHPSLIVAPMLVETGAPALFSNLDLLEVRNRQGEEPDKTSLEMFRSFPEARRKCKLSTAVRLNASFPYISPAVGLPFEPERRAVDAGYYDNFGVDLATDYLGSASVFKAITTSSSRVLIIEVRAFPSDAPTPVITPLARALQFLTTPAEGISTARGSSQAFRNGQVWTRLWQDTRRQTRIGTTITPRSAESRSARSRPAATFQ